MLRIGGIMAEDSGRAILVLDDSGERRTHLMARLADRGLPSVAPKTPLEAIDLLSRSSPRLALVAAETPMHGFLADDFPWLNTAEITDDLDDTIDRVVVALDDTI